jgi:pyruvate dehydrogenase E2 component (dihydrolipoamide acetyltransferase)
MAKLVASVLGRHPSMAVRWNEDHSDLIPATEEQFHVGIAVDTADGLLVAVVRDVANQPLESVVQQSRALIERSRSGRLTRDEMGGGLLTITNLGAYGIDHFTPIINAPEIAILGMGAIQRQPWFDAENRLVPQHRMGISLTFDHAAIDGAPAAAFLKDLVDSIETVVTPLP